MDCDRAESRTRGIGDTALRSIVSFLIGWDGFFLLITTGSLLLAARASDVFDDMLWMDANIHVSLDYWHQAFPRALVFVLPKPILQILGSCCWGLLLASHVTLVSPFSISRAIP
jgi:hypothetical protein